MGLPLKTDIQKLTAGIAIPSRPQPILGAPGAQTAGPRPRRFLAGFLRVKMSKFFEQRWRYVSHFFLCANERLCWRVLFPANQGRALCSTKNDCWL
jgi:hypothetical protein